MLQTALVLHCFFLTYLAKLSVRQKKAHTLTFYLEHLEVKSEQAKHKKNVIKDNRKLWQQLCKCVFVCVCGVDQSGYFPLALGRGRSKVSIAFSVLSLAKRFVCTAFNSCCSLWFFHCLLSLRYLLLLLWSMYFRCSFALSVIVFVGGFSGFSLL